MKWTKWTPEKVREFALKEQTKRMGQACAMVVRTAKQKLNTPFSHKTKRKQYTTKKGYIRYRIVEAGHSAPGEPPRRITGRLYGSVYLKVVRDGTRVRGFVYSNDKKARRLELGFHGRDSRGRKMDQAPRPWLRPSFRENLTQIRKILGAK